MADPTARTLAARIGGLHRAATADLQALGQAGQRGLLAKFYRETDEALPEPERWKKAELLLKAHMSRLALNRRKGAKA